MLTLQMQQIQPPAGARIEHHWNLQRKHNKHHSFNRMEDMSVLARITTASSAHHAGTESGTKNKRTLDNLGGVNNDRPKWISFQVTF